jgi:hypothetical protein
LYTSATPYTVWSQVAACFNSPSDVDYYVFTVPTNAAGGYIIASASMLEIVDGGGQIGANIKILASDQTLLASMGSSTSMQSVYAYAPVTSGTTYYVSVSSTQGTATPSRYSLLVTYTPINDPYEPNKSRAAAAAISANQTITAFMFAGFTTGTIGPFPDYFKVPLQAGSVTVNLLNSPSNIAIAVTLYDPLFNSLKSMGPNTGGGLVMIGPVTVANTGTYYVGFAPSGTNPGSQAGAGSTLPDNFVTPYSFNVVQ